MNPGKIATNPLVWALGFSALVHGAGFYVAGPSMRFEVALHEDSNSVEVHLVSANQAVQTVPVLTPEPVPEVLTADAAEPVVFQSESPQDAQPEPEPPPLPRLEQPPPEPQLAVEMPPADLPMPEQSEIDTLMEMLPVAPTTDEGAQAQLAAPAASGVDRSPQQIGQRCPPPDYPPTALRERRSGVVVLEVNVNEKGRAEAARVLQSTGYNDLDRAAKRAVCKRWRFRPAERDGEAVAGALVVQIDFRLLN